MDHFSFSWLPYSSAIRRVLFGLVGVFFLYAPTAVYANTCEATGTSTCYYASPNGTGVGTLADPGSIQSTTQQLSAGDFLYLRGGDYTQTYLMDDFDVILNLDKGFRFQNPQPSNAQPVTIKGYPGETAVLRGDNSRPCAVIDGSSHIVISNLTIRDCFNIGVVVGANAPASDIRFDGVVMSNIQYNDNSAFIQVHSYSQVVIENSTFHDYIPRSSDNFVGSYLKFFQARDILVQNNLFYGNGGGIYYKHGERTLGSGGFTRIIGNTFRNLSRHAVYTNQNRTEVTGNLILNSEVQVHQEDGTRGVPFTKNVVISYNTMVNSGVVLNEGCESGCTDGLSDLGASDATVNNNIFKDSNYQIWRYGSNSQYDKGINLTSTNNCFDHSSGQQFSYFSSTNFGSKGQTHTLASWQAAGWGNGSIETNSQLQADYSIPAGTACINMGHTAYGSQPPSSGQSVPNPPLLFSSL